MKHSVQLFLAIQFCIAANISIAMELKAPKKSPKILAKITCIKDPFQAHYLTENRILINGRNQCSIVDPTTNKEIKRIFDDNDGYSSCIAVHPHKTKFALAAYHLRPNHTHPNDAQQKITIHNAKTYDVESIIDWDTIDGTTIEKIVFSPLEDTIATSGNGNITVILYNYTTKNIIHINVPEARSEHYNYGNPRDPIVAFHPTQPLMCLAWKSIYIHDLTTSTRNAIPKTLNYYDFCEYSPDGSFIVMGTNDKISCRKPDHMPHFTAIPQKCFYKNVIGYFHGMATHPNGNILVTLSKTCDKTGEAFCIANYHDIKMSKRIATTNLPLKIPSYQTSFSFSPNGKKLLIVAIDLCAELKVPFKVFYKDITKKQLFYLLFLLKNYTHSCADVEIPEDVNLLIGKILLETYKR